MDGIVFKVRDNGKIINKTVYLCVGLKQNGLKEVLGMWVGKSGALLSGSVLTDLKARGVQDILITCTDNLNGFTDTKYIPSVISNCGTSDQTPVNMWFIRIRKSLDMKNIYNAPNKEVAATELDNLEKKWEESIICYTFMEKQLG